MAGYRVTRRARRDILEIWERIAQDSLQHADLFVDRLVRQFQLLGQNPYLGRKRDELIAGSRSIALGDYLVFYSVTNPGVRVLHVVHGRRNLERLLRE